MHPSVCAQDAAEFVAAAPPNIAATVTPQHMLLNRNALFAKGLRPHNFCLPILKREKHREWLAQLKHPLLTQAELL